MIRVTFTDGSVSTYETGVDVLDSQDGSLMFVRDSKEIVLGTLTVLEVRQWEKLL